MFGKVFASMYKGTLYGQWQAIITMQQLIVLADAEGVVDMTPPAISAHTSIPLDIIETGLKILQQPDPYSRTPDNEGRRIELIDPSRPWGWVLVNHKFYRDLASEQDRRDKTRERVRRFREKQKESATSDTGNAPVTPSNASNAIQKQKQDTDTGKKDVRFTDAVREVFTHWQTVHDHPRAKLDAKRKRAITARLKDGYTVDDLKRAVDGCKTSPHHQGQNDTGTVYDDIELICRDAKHVDQFLKQKPSRGLGAIE